MRPRSYEGQTAIDLGEFGLTKAEEKGADRPEVSNLLAKEPHTVRVLNHSPSQDRATAERISSLR